MLEYGWLDPYEKLQWNFNRNSTIFFHEMASESAVYYMAAILSRLQCVCVNCSSNRCMTNLLRLLLSSVYRCVLWTPYVGLNIHVKRQSRPGTVCACLCLSTVRRHFNKSTREIYNQWANAICYLGKNDTKLCRCLCNILSNSRCDNSWFASCYIYFLRSFPSLGFATYKVGSYVSGNMLLSSANGGAQIPSLAK